MVLWLDFGKVTTVRLTDMKPIPVACLSKGKMAIPVSLTGKRQRWGSVSLTVSPVFFVVLARAVLSRSRFFREVFLMRHRYAWNTHCNQHLFVGACFTLGRLVTTVFLIWFPERLLGGILVTLRSPDYRSVELLVVAKTAYGMAFENGPGAVKRRRTGKNPHSVKP